MLQENQLAILSGEVTYLKEHELTVMRKSSELRGKMSDIEASIATNAHKLTRERHANALMIAEKQKDIQQLEAENREVEAKFEAVKADVRVLYADKVKMRRQLVAAKAEAADVQACVDNYRRSIANMIDE